MAVRFPSLLAALVLILCACSQEPAIQADENSAANDAMEVGDVVQNSVVNALDNARNAVDAVAGTDAEVEMALAAEQPPGWGSDADAFTGKDIALDPIVGAGTLHRSGEMGCGFIPSSASAPVLVAKADVDPGAHAVAVIANGGVRERLASAVAGGFGALAGGTSLVGKGVTVDISLTSRVSLTPVGRQSSYPASLTVTVGKERQRIYAGRWICGLQG